jgi:hypothetical protein
MAKLFGRADDHIRPRMLHDRLGTALARIPVTLWCACVVGLTGIGMTFRAVDKESVRGDGT